jgi:hypothetical protein
MAAKRTSKATIKILHRVNESLAGTDLFTYTRAVFSVLGIDQPKSKGTRPGNVTGFYNSGSILRHHVGNGNMEKIDGMIRLTAKGRGHFQARIKDDSAQFVDKAEAASIAKAIRSGKVSDLPSEWRTAVTFSPVTIR